MDNPRNERTIRELGGEISAELSYAYGDVVEWQTLESAIEVIMGVLARHVGVKLTNDDDLPVLPLPRSDSIR